jgi:hypothetical protein
MDVKKIKNDRNYFWTNHVKNKMFQYGLSPQIVRKVIGKPERIERGIAPRTTAQMIRKDGKKIKKEIWVMWQKKLKAENEKLKAEKENKNLFHGVKIISAWIYPGVSPKGKEIFIPEDVWTEI